MGKGTGSSGSVATAGGGHTAVRGTDGVKWRKSDRAIRDGDVAVKVDVGKLDKAWGKDSSHLPPGGGSDKGKYANAGKAIASGGKGKKGPVGMPQATYDSRTKTVSVSDGRHRAAAARDKGKKTIYITVPRSQAKKAARDLG